MLPRTTGVMTFLRTLLFIVDCTGGVPDEVKQLPSIQELQVSDNKLEGEREMPHDNIF